MEKAQGKSEAVCEMCSGAKAEAFCRQCTYFICSDCRGKDNYTYISRLGCSVVDYCVVEIEEFPTSQ